MPGQRRQTPLHCGGGEWPQGRGELLLAKDSRRQCQEQRRRDAFALAAGKGHKDVAELLLASKAEVNAKDNDGATPLHYGGGLGPQGRGGIAAGQQGRGQCQGQRRRDAFARGGAQGPQGRGGIAAGQQGRGQCQGQQRHDAFALAAVDGHKDVAELLLANKAEVNAKDDGARTPLHWAAGAGHRDVSGIAAGQQSRRECQGESPSSRSGGNLQARYRAYFYGDNANARKLEAHKAD